MLAAMSVARSISTVRSSPAAQPMLPWGPSGQAEPRRTKATGRAPTSRRAEARCSSKVGEKKTPRKIKPICMQSNIIQHVTRLPIFFISHSKGCVYFFVAFYLH